MIRTNDSARPSLLLWDGHNQVSGEVVEYRGRRYEPGAIHHTILRELNLPATVETFGSVRDLLGEICKLLDQFVGLQEKCTALIGRFVLATWLVDAMQTAPRILIDGPDIRRARQLLEVLRCVCRRALPVSGITPTAFCSLPSGLRFTLLLNQPVVSSALANVLHLSTLRGNPLLRSGELRDMFGAQAILSDSDCAEDNWRGSSIRVPCMPIGAPVPVLDDEQRRRIVEEFQPKLLAFRFANHAKASSTRFDTSKFAIPLRDLAHGLAAATPEEDELQGDLHPLFQVENAEIQAANWVNLNTVIIEAMLVYCREGKLESVYVGGIAEMAQKILEGRGEARNLDPGEVGRRIKSLGFSTEPRDARGMKLRLSRSVCLRVHDLAHQFDVPGVKECECKNVGHVG